MNYVIKNMKILNGHKNMVPVSGKAIVVKDGRIAEICNENDVLKDVKTIDLDGKYLLPGLINLHVHIPANGRPKTKKVDYEKAAKLLKLALARNVIRGVCRTSVKQQLLSGTTTIRAVGGVINFDTALRDKINNGEIEGPRILAANTAISVPGGHMTGSVALPVNSAEEAVKMVEDLDKENPDLIKLMITGGVLDAEVPGEPGILKMPPEYVAAATKRAHELGYKVAAHVESTEGMELAIDNGVDTLEHGGCMTEKLAEKIKKNGSAVIATMSPVIPYSVMSQEISKVSDMDRLNGTALFKNFIQCYKMCVDKGVTLGLGTDTGCEYVTHYDTWRELAWLCKYCDFTPQYALHTATMINAKIVDLQDETGSVDVGKSADFMVVEKNPLDDITELRYPKDVFFKGKRYHNPKIKKMPFVEEQLDIINDTRSKDDN